MFRIRECIRLKEEWWYVDVGYFTEQITRYPNPIIHDKDRTYFRIVKRRNTYRWWCCNSRCERLLELENKEIDVDTLRVGIK